MTGWLAFVASAGACGGLFCSPGPTFGQPAVNQAAEEVLFYVDERLGTVTAHVKIFYDGPVDDFSWVVPVPGVPELSTGTDALFTALRGTDATWDLVRVTEPCGTHGTGAGTGTGTGTGSGTGTGGGTPGGVGTVPGVDVVLAEAVGPFDTVVLAADDSAALVAWLTLNDYALPPDFDPAVAPYIAAGQYFLAMKLAKDNDVGDLVPIVMTYPGDRAIVPLTLTRVAAVEDMPLRIYVVGQHRAVPENYLHVHPNPLAIHWWFDAFNAEYVVSQAVDEAGGHAFMTDFAGTGVGIAMSVYRPGWTVLGLELLPDAYEFLVEVARRGLPADDAMLAALEASIPVPDELAAVGVSSPQLYGCPLCYEAELRAAPFDAVQAAAAIESEVLVPRRAASDLLTGQPVLTRLTSSASPREMTVDPIFVLNADMDQFVAARRTATFTSWCGLGPNGFARELDVGFPVTVGLPSAEQLSAMGMDEFQFLDPVSYPFAWIVERTGATGQPEVLVDNTDAILDGIRLSNHELRGRRGSDDPFTEPERSVVFAECGCDGSGSGSGVWALLGLPLVLGVRRARPGGRGSASPAG